MIDLIRFGSNVLLIPLLGMIWSIQGRISKIEGKLDILTERGKK